MLEYTIDFSISVLTNKIHSFTTNCQSEFMLNRLLESLIKSEDYIWLKATRADGTVVLEWKAKPYQPLF